MNIRLYRFVDRFFGPPICAVLSAFAWMTRRPISGQPRKILVILLSEMGSQVLASPMFARLKRQYPDAALHLLLFARNRETVELLDLVPAQNVIALDDRSFARLVRDVFRALRELHALRADVAIDCELFARLSAIFSFLSGAPARVGFHRFTQEGLYRGSFVTRPVLYNPYRHISDQFVTLANAIESKSVPCAKQARTESMEMPTLNGLNEAEIQSRIAQLHRDFPAIQDRSLVLVYASGGILPIRAWPLEHYQKLCASLIEQGYAVGVIGLPSDGALGGSIVAHCRVPHCVNLCGYTDSMRHLLALYHRASLLVANDGAPGQFASITTLPTILLFGPETPVLYAPPAPSIHSMYLGFSCSPCLTAFNHRNSPCDGDNQCLKQITVKSVLEKANELLAAPVLARSTDIR
ncbi:MAG TPA: glycosyltransferase family 9 protein [Verrucomicrobiae bacterium]|nr:glycosyltransferase family 9 protein [Verrucomicrobiae bacterium]